MFSIENRNKKRPLQKRENSPGLRFSMNYGYSKISLLFKNSSAAT